MFGSSSTPRKLISLSVEKLLKRKETPGTKADNQDTEDEIRIIDYKQATEDEIRIIHYKQDTEDEIRIIQLHDVITKEKGNGHFKSLEGKEVFQRRKVC